MATLEKIDTKETKLEAVKAAPVNAPCRFCSYGTPAGRAWTMP